MRVECKWMKRWFAEWDGTRKSFGTEAAAYRWLAKKLLCELVPVDYSRKELDDNGNDVTYLVQLSEYFSLSSEWDWRTLYRAMRNQLAAQMQGTAITPISHFPMAIRYNESETSLRKKMLAIVEERYCRFLQLQKGEQQ